MVKLVDQLDIMRALTEVGAPSSDFDLNPDLKPTNKTPLKPAGVLLPLIERPHGTQVILTKRSQMIRHHPGQIAFPGGKVDLTDADHIEAALREAQEEIGLSPDLVSVLGELSPHITTSNYTMQPVVGWIKEDFPHKMEEQEVSEIFEVPLSHILNMEKYSIQSRVWGGHARHFFSVPYGPHYIWGATARVLRSFAEKVNQL